MIQDLNERFGLFLALLVNLMLLGPALACTVTWQLQARDGTPISNHTTQTACDAAGKTLKRTAATVYGCPRFLVCPANATAPVVTPPVVTPPVVTPPVTGTWVEGRITTAEPSAPLPAKGVATADPTFKHAVYRVTDRSEPPVGLARNDYSRRQAFNADNSRQLVSALDGYWHVYNAATFAHEKRLPGLAGDAEPQWHPTNPDLLYYLPTNGVGMKLLELNVSTGVSRTVADFAARLKAIWPTANAAWTKSEGSPSADGRYWCFMVDNAAWGGVGQFTWDLQTDTIIGTRTSSERPDHLSMSPSGRWCVVGSDGATGVAAFSPDFKTSKQILKASQHSDIAIGADGADVFVAVDYAANAGDVFMFDIDKGVRTDLFPSYPGDGSVRAFHFSGKAFGRPGWVLVSAQAENTNGKPLSWMDRKLTLVELKAGGRVLNVAWHRAGFPDGDYYFFSPVGSISRDGTRIAFTSSWGGKTHADINAYQVRLPGVPQ